MRVSRVLQARLHRPYNQNRCRPADFSLCGHARASAAHTARGWYLAVITIPLYTDHCNLFYGRCRENFSVLSPQT